MSIDDEIHEIVDRIKRLVHDAYRRGETDAIERLVRAARSGHDIESHSDLASDRTASNAPRKARAPKGAVGTLVDRSLVGGASMTPVEIKGQAADEHERRIALPSIRAHLRRGKGAKYLEKGGRWYKTGASETAEAATPAGEQAASDLWSEQEDHR